MPSRRVVRKPLSIRARSRRAPEERLAVRFPQLFGLLVRLVTRLAPQSRIRQAMIWRSMELAFAAVNRRDFDVVLPRYDPDVEILPARELVEVGVAASFRGHDGFLSFWEDSDSVWAGARWEPKELIDLGDRLLTLGKMRASGQASGIAVDVEIAVLMTLKEGRVIREEHYTDAAEALRAARLQRRAETHPAALRSASPADAPD